MANNYKGYLLKFGSKVMPNNYFLEYSSTPNQRLDSDSSGRNNLGDLNRSVLKHHKSNITFSTHFLFLDEKLNFQSIINSGMTNSAERKCRVTYWNDEDNSYHTGYFYIPDITYTVDDANSKDIRYQPITVELVEY